MERTVRTFYVLQYDASLEGSVSPRWVLYDGTHHDTSAEAQDALARERRYANAPPLRIAMVTQSTVAWEGDTR
jgi:hypothetical protein